MLLLLAACGPAEEAGSAPPVDVAQPLAPREGDPCGGNSFAGDCLQLKQYIDACGVLCPDGKTRLAGNRGCTSAFLTMDGDEPSAVDGVPFPKNGQVCVTRTLSWKAAASPQTAVLEWSLPGDACCPGECAEMWAKTVEYVQIHEDQHVDNVLQAVHEWNKYWPQKLTACGPSLAAVKKQLLSETVTLTLKMLNSLHLDMAFEPAPVDPINCDPCVEPLSIPDPPPCVKPVEECQAGVCSVALEPDGTSCKGGLGECVQGYCDDGCPGGSEKNLQGVCVCDRNAPLDGSCQCGEGFCDANQKCLECGGQILGCTLDVPTKCCKTQACPAGSACMYKADLIQCNSGICNDPAQLAQAQKEGWTVEC